MPSVEDYYRPHPPFKIISDIPEVQALYVESKRKGTAHALAEMFAFQAAPALKTATRWIAGHERTIKDGMPEIVRKRMMDSAKAAGVTCDGSVYKSQLAAYPGDPHAWVSSEEDCKRVAEKRGLKLEGGINYTPPAYHEEPISDVRKPYHVAPDLVDAHFHDLCENHPEEKRRPGAKAELAVKLAGGESE